MLENDAKKETVLGNERETESYEGGVRLQSNAYPRSLFILRL